MDQQLKIKIGNVTLEGQLVCPEKTSGLVLFSHGSGSSRFSPRNNFVAQQLQRKGLSTFLFDLLTKEEDDVYHNRFNIQLLAQRLADVTRHLLKIPAVKNLPIGYFGASTGAASAIVAASILPTHVKAIVSRGGRPDLGQHSLELIQSPILLIVGALDQQVIALNRQAMEKIHTTKVLKIVEGATHLFEEPGTLEEVAQLSGDWFIKYLTVKPSFRLEKTADCERA